MLKNDLDLPINRFSISNIGFFFLQRDFLHGFFLSIIVIS
jgi:hypothetical protein